MEKKIETDLQDHHPEKRLQVATVRRAYEDLFLKPVRPENRYDAIKSMDWLTSASNKKERDKVFDLAGINRESMNRDMLDIVKRYIKRNTI